MAIGSGHAASAALLLCAVGAAQAQTAQVSPANVAASQAPANATPGPRRAIAEGTPIVVELAEPVSSRTARRGQSFAIRLTSDLTLNGRVVMPAGAPGRGEVVDAAPGALAGRPGMLILAARTLDGGGLHLRLRGFKLAGSGRDDSKTVAALSVTPYVGILALAAHGGNIDYPAGARAIAKVAAETPIPPPTNALGAPPGGTGQTAPRTQGGNP